MAIHQDGPFGRVVSGAENHAVPDADSLAMIARCRAFWGVSATAEGDGVDEVKISGEYSVLPRDPNHAVLGKYGPDATLPRQ